MERAAVVNASFNLNEIVEKRQPAPSLVMWKLYVPDIAKRVKPGQFVVLRADDRAERIPLTVADFDREKGHDHGHLPGSGRIHEEARQVRAGTVDPRCGRAPGQGEPHREIRHGRLHRRRRGRGAGLSHRKGPLSGGQRDHLHHRRTDEGDAHPRRRDEGDQPRAFRDYRRRLLRAPRIRHGRAEEAHRREKEDRPRPRHRPGRHDEGGRGNNQTLQPQDRREPQLRHDRRHGHVRRLPDDGRGRDEVRLC